MTLRTPNPSYLFDLSREDRSRLGNLTEVLTTGELFRHREAGPVSMSERLERRLADHFGQEAAAAVANGTAGLRLALHAVGVRPGDRVLVSAYSFIACAMSVVGVGAIPVPIDLDGPLGLDLGQVQRHVTGARAVLAVHVQGHALALRALRQICDQAGVPLIEDACQALGAASSDGPAGGVADMTVTSFQQAKQISSGEGGLIAGRKELIEHAFRLADLGAVRTGPRPDWDDPAARIGENLRLGELQAALALDQLDQLGTTLQRQRQVRDAWWAYAGPDLQPVLSDLPAADSGAHTLLLAASAMAAREFCDSVSAHGTAVKVVWPRAFVDFGVMRRCPQVQEGIAVAGTPHQAVQAAPRLVSVTLSKYAGDADIARTGDAVLAHLDLLVEPRPMSRSAEEEVAR